MGVLGGVCMPRRRRICTEFGENQGISDAWRGETRLGVEGYQVDNQ